MTTSVRETLCVHNAASPDTDHVCDWCQSIIDFQPQRGWNAPLHPEEHERAMGLFGGPTGTSARKWNTLMVNTHHLDHVQWARLENDDDPITNPPDSWVAYDDLTQAVLRGDHLSQRQEAMLREGIGFHDGSVLRYLDGEWNINGSVLHGLSLFVVFSLMGDVSKRRGWDIPALLVCATSVNPELRHSPRLVQHVPRGRRELRPSYRPLAAMLTWLSTRLKIDRTLSMEAREYVPMMAWSHDIQSRMFERQPPNMEGMFQNALSHHPPGLFHAYGTPWMQAWRNLESAHEQAETQKWAMDLNPKALRIRTRTASGSLRLIRVPCEPSLWAFLSSLALSPLNSEGGKLLLGLQHNWSVGYIERSRPSPALVRSLQFCHSIMNDLEGKVHLERARALVVGQLGHVYEVAVEHGQHGAPYTIQHVTDITPNVKRSICIHSGQFANTLPLGDTMGSVLLSMVNDIKASEEIPSLEEVLLHHPPFGFPRQNIPPAWLDRVIGDAAQYANPTRYFFQHLRWYRRDLLEVDEMERRPGAGLHELLIRNRHHRRRPPRFSERWAARFHTVFDRDGRFPLEEAIAEWRETVPPYVPGRTETQGFGDYFGRFQEGLFNRRYHHLMPHRRGDDLHEEGDVRDGERRWCEVFARVWEVLVHQPLGAQFRLPLNDGAALSLQHADLRVTVRSELERNFFTRAAKMLGYVKDEEDQTHTVLIRRDHPRPNARLQLTDLLRDMQDRQRVRGAPPRWWNYVDVVAPPRQVPHFRWQLHMDHQDTRRAADRDDSADREFSGLGDLFG